MSVKAQLGGHNFDLERLAELFSRGDPKVVKTDEGFFLEATALDGLFHEASRMREAATLILARFNGVARLRDASFRPVRLLNRYVNDAGSGYTMIDVGDEARVRDTAVVVVGTAEARLGALNGRVAVNGVVAEPEAPGARYLDLASVNTDVAELLTLVGDADKLTGEKLYKAFEIIRVAVGGGQKGLVSTGWTTDPELNAFTGSVNHPAVSGAGARHARLTKDPPKTAMTSAECQQFIRDLADKWFRSLW